MPEERHQRDTRGAIDIRLCGVEISGHGGDILLLGWCHYDVTQCVPVHWSLLVFSWGMQSSPSSRALIPKACRRLRDEILGVTRGIVIHMQLAKVVIRKTPTLELEDLFPSKESSEDSSLRTVGTKCMEPRERSRPVGGKTLLQQLVVGLPKYSWAIGGITREIGFLGYKHSG